MNPSETSLPPEISCQLDPLNHCRAATIHGACAYLAIRGENFCLEHSSSTRGRELRDCRLTQLRANLRREWREGKETAWPGHNGVLMSDRQAEYLRDLKTTRGIDYPAKSDELTDEARQLSFPFMTPGFKELERLQDLAPSEEAQELGQMAATYLACQSAREQQRAEEVLMRKKAKAAVQEMLETRRELRRENYRKQRVKEQSEIVEERSDKIYFRGDLSTPYGLAAAGDALARLYAEGRITQRRCDTLMKSLRIMVIARVLGSGRPIRPPDLPSSLPAGATVVDADLRPYEMRRVELKNMRDRLMRKHVSDHSENSKLIEGSSQPSEIIDGSEIT
jgi:hypothetical protein